MKISGCSPLYLHICTCISISIILIYLYINISCSSIHLSIQPSIFSILSIDPFIQPSIHPFSLATHLSIYLSISVSIHSSIHPFSLSIYLVSWPFCLTQNHTALKLQSQIQKNDCSPDSGTCQSQILSHETVAHGSHLLMISKHRLTQPGV